MPYKEKEIEKLYYSISEVAKMFDVSNSLIRFWESEFDSLKPKKNKKGNRLFTKKDIDQMRIIYHLVKEQGHTLEGAKKRIKEQKGRLDTQVEVVTKLKEIKSFLQDLSDKL